MAFGFFDGQKADASPESIKRKRAMIAQLLSGGRAPRDVGEGLHAIGRGLQAAVLGSRADAAEQAGNASSAEAMRNIYSGFGGAPVAAVGGPPVAPLIAPSSGSSQRDEPTGAPSTALAQSTSSPDESVYGPVMPPEFFQVAGDLSDRAPFAQGKMETPEGLVIHHTGGRGTPEGIMDVFRQRGLATQYVMDRDGKVFRSLPEGTRGRHLRPSEINNISNSNALGIEIIARDDADVTPQQRAAAQNFTNYASSKYGFNPKNVFGHGELNSHKQSTEGMSAVADWRTYKGTGAPERSTAVAAAQPRTMQDRTLMAYAGGARAPSASSPFDAEIRAASQQTGIPENIIRAKIKQESGFNPAARGGSGEVGLAQILPSTAARPGYGVQPLPADKLADPAANINFGAQYLAARGRAAGVTDWNDPNQAAQGLTAYNGGGDPNYAANVLRYLPNGGATPVPLARQGIVDQGADGVSDAQSGALDAGGSEAEQVNTGNIYSPVPMGLGDNPFLPRRPVAVPPAQPDPVAVAPSAPMPVGVNPAQGTTALPAANIQPPQSPLVPQAMRQPMPMPMDMGGENSGGGAMQFIESEFARREGRPDPRMAIGAPQGYNPFVQQPTQAPQMAGDGGSVQGASQGSATASGSAQAPAQARQSGMISPQDVQAVMSNPFTSEADKRFVMDMWNQQRARAHAEVERARQEQQSRQAYEAANMNPALRGDPNIAKQSVEANFREKPEQFRNLTPAERLQNNIDPNDRRPYQISTKTGKVSGVGGAQTTVNVGASEGPDGKMRETLAKQEGEQFGTHLKAGTTAAGSIQDLDMLDQLIKVAPTGPLTGRLAQMFPGISNGAAAFESVVKRVAPTLRVEGSGATSDIEYQGMLSALPQLVNRPEANQAISQMMRAKSQVNLERAQVVRELQAMRISPDAARAQINEIDKRSILTPQLRQMLQFGEKQSGPAVGTVQGGWRFKGGNPADRNAWEKVQ